MKSLGKSLLLFSFFDRKLANLKAKRALRARKEPNLSPSQIEPRRTSLSRTFVSLSKGKKQEVPYTRPMSQEK